MELDPVTINILNDKLISVYSIYFNQRKKGSSDDINIFDHADSQSKIKSSSTDIYADLPLFRIDTVLDLMKKISIYTGIAYYKQCLCYDDYTPVGYNALLYNKPINIDIRDIISTSSRIGNINIDLHYYESHDDIRVVDKSTFMSLYDVLRSKSVLNLISLDLFINDKLPSLDLQTYQDLYYYGCVYKYWPIITRAVFLSYLLTPKEFISMYPLLDIQTTELKYVYELQHKILKNIKFHEVNFYKYTGDSSLNMQINNIVLQNNSNPNTFNMRIMFDMIHITNSIQLICLKSSYADKPIRVYKTRMSTESDYIMEIEQYIDIIKTDEDKNAIYIVYKPYDNMLMILKIDDRNTHTIHCKLFNNSALPVTDIVQRCKDTIKHDMTQLKRVFAGIYDNHDYEIRNISLYLNWKHNINTGMFMQIPKYYEDHIQAGILTDISDDNNAYFEFIYYKGINTSELQQYNLDTDDNEIELSNEFEYLSDLKEYTRWHQYVNTGQLLRVYYLFNQIQFEMRNITSSNFNTIYSFIKHFISDFPTVVAQSTDIKLDQSIALKSLDPVLYSQLTNDRLYSRICQKRYQPEMVIDISTIDPSKRSKYIKYYNFTSKTPVYYTCPNPDYPQFSFLTDIHSSNFCVPCCKKKAVYDKNMYTTCLKNHVYIESTDNVSKKSRYIINYGKSIEYKRIGHLPYSLHQFFTEHGTIIESISIPDTFVYNDTDWHVDTFIHRKTSDIPLSKFKHILSVPITDVQYTILDVLQNQQLNSYLYSIIRNLLYRPLIATITKEGKYVLLWHSYILAKYYMNDIKDVPVILISSSELKHHTIVGGIEKDGMYFYGNLQTYNDINVSLLYCLSIAINKSLSELLIDILAQLNSNRTIRDLLSSQYNCNIISELSSISVTQYGLPWNKIAIDIAHYLYEIEIVVFYIKNDRLRLKLSTRKRKTYPMMLVYKRIEYYRTYLKLRNYYLIGYFDLKHYFKTQEPTTVLFSSDSNICKIINNVVQYLNTKNNRDLFYTFLIHAHAQVIELYINTTGYYYMALVQWNKKHILFPIFYQEQADDTKTSARVYNTDQATISYRELMEFLSLFNEFLIQNNVYNISFDVQSIIKYGTKYIGLIANDLYFFCMPTKTINDDELASIGVTEIKYDPNDINRIILHSDNTYDLTKDLAKCYYNTHLYFIFCVQIAFNVDKLHKITTPEQLYRYFHIVPSMEPIFEFPNIMLSCSARMPYCKDSKMIISQKHFDYCSKLFIDEISKNKIQTGRLFAYLLNNFFQFTKSTTENLYIEYG